MRLETHPPTGYKAESVLPSTNSITLGSVSCSDLAAAARLAINSSSASQPHPHHQPPPPPPTSVCPQPCQGRRCTYSPSSGTMNTDRVEGILLLSQVLLPPTSSQSPPLLCPVSSLGTAPESIIGPGSFHGKRMADQAACVAQQSVSCALLSERTEHSLVGGTSVMTEAIKYRQPFHLP